MDESGRGKIGCAGVILLLALAAAMIFFNPSLETHKAAIYEHARNQAAAEGVWARIKAKAAETAGVLDIVPLEYHNYVVCSTTTNEDKTLSVGVLGKVFVLP